MFQNLLPYNVKVNQKRKDKYLNVLQCSHEQTKKTLTKPFCPLTEKVRF